MKLDSVERRSEREAIDQRRALKKRDNKGSAIARSKAGAASWPRDGRIVGGLKETETKGKQGKGALQFVAFMAAENVLSEPKLFHLEISLDRLRELCKVRQALTQHTLYERKIYFQIPMYQHVSETCDSTETPRELR